MCFPEAAAVQLPGVNTGARQGTQPGNHPLVSELSPESGSTCEAACHLLTHAVSHVDSQTGPQAQLMRQALMRGVRSACLGLAAVTSESLLHSGYLPAAAQLLAQASRGTLALDPQQAGLAQQRGRVIGPRTPSCDEAVAEEAGLVAEALELLEACVLPAAVR